MSSSFQRRGATSSSNSSSSSSSRSISRSISININAVSILLALAALLVIAPHESNGFVMPQQRTSTRAPPAAPTSSSALDMAGETSEAAEQNAFGVVSDAVTGAAFSLLHAFDDCGIEDSSKNLRVLWVRALLNQKGMIEDDIAETLLPKTTRGLVTTDEGASLFDPILKFTEWIQARTDFIDKGLDNFLASPVCTSPEGEMLECNVVMFGAGYDTRALRYRHHHDEKINFIEVDLPSVVEGKSKLYEKFQQENDPTWDLKKLGSTLVPMDLNTCGGDNPVSLVETLRRVGGLKKNVPTFFVWEAVLFYVNEDAVRNIMDDLFTFAQLGSNGDSPRAETMICFTDSLKPFVDVPFTNEATKFFADNELDLLEHRSRWGGAVHFALAATRGMSLTASSAQAAAEDESPDAEDIEALKDEIAAGSFRKLKKDKVTGQIGSFVSKQVGGLVNSYTPTQANNHALVDNPSFDNAWYAIGYPWQIDGYDNAVLAALDENNKKKASTINKPFASRLWGEPLVIYRDDSGELVAMADVCPHRSAPLSMGTVENGQLTCFYHGWKFGEKGECEDIPTLQAMEGGGDTVARDARYKDRVTKANCGHMRAVVEHEGIVFIWRGNVLEADPKLLPSKRKGDMETVPMDSVLDYNVDYSYIVENNLDSPHLFYLHDGSVPPIEDIGLVNQNLSKLRLTAFTDDCGYGHLGKLGKNGRPKKLIRFDPPNIVRHGGVSGFEEEFHCIPIAPHRTRVLIRQHLPKGPILSTVTSVPYMKPFLTALVNSWNYHIGLEDAAVMQGQAHRIEDLGAPRMSVGGLGDDLIKRYWKWRAQAHSNLKDDNGVKSPYFNSISDNGLGSSKAVGIASGTVHGDAAETVARVRADSRLKNQPLISDDGQYDAVTGNPIGSWGIKQNYIQDTPAANFPPMNYKPYANLLVFDDLVKSLVAGKEPSYTMVKTQMSDLNSKEQLSSSSKEKKKPKRSFIGMLAAASAVLVTDVAMGGSSLGRSVASAMEHVIPGEVMSFEDRAVLSSMMYSGTVGVLQDLFHL